MFGHDRERDPNHSRRHPGRSDLGNHQDEEAALFCYLNGLSQILQCILRLALRFPHSEHL